MNAHFWEIFYQQLPEEIPWQETHFDWFRELVEKKVIHGSSALDLGCGIGKKSIVLAKNGFKKVVGVDITSQAISYARENARELQVDDRCVFYVENAVGLEFLGDEKFDFIVDWALLHTLPKTVWKDYVKGICKHVVPGKTHLLLRTFSDKGSDEVYYETEAGGITIRIHLVRREDVMDCFGTYFEIIEEHQSEAATKLDLVFDEYLMVAR